MQNFKYLDICDISFIKLKLNESDNSIWEGHTYRQSTFSPHRHTQTIELMWDKESLNEIREATKHPNFYGYKIDELFDRLHPLYTLNYGEGYFCRTLITKLKAKKHIFPHKDGGDSLEKCHRTHIPIITNDKVTFQVNGENKYMKEGEIWEIDNVAEHAVYNQSDFDRIHLILDYMQFI